MSSQSKSKRHDHNPGPDLFRHPATSHRPGRPLMRRYVVLLGCALILLMLDQAVKALVIRSLGHGAAIELGGGLVRLDLTRNSGAAFGMFQSDGPVFALVAVAVGLLILGFYRRIAGASLAVRLALGLILGGALGNLVDRVRLGYVVDYIDLRWWYVFNLADSAIVLGVVALLLLSSAEAGTGQE